ncbi:MAG: hypothetical protein IJQ81_10530, partial [Oscillibacter sp.]|nr:hypothetical protein [Oscillibacter sp.]
MCATIALKPVISDNNKISKYTVTIKIYDGSGKREEELLDTSKAALLQSKTFDVIPVQEVQPEQP